MSTQPANLSRPIALVGLMGAGKSKIGKALSERFAVPFIDTDNVIENVVGMAISTIFEMHGEVKFRAIEAREIKKLVTAKPAIISAGGGAFIQDETRAIINQSALSVWLKADPKTLASRISDTATRPLLQGGDPEKVLTELSKKRSPYYKQAHITIDTDGLSLADAIDEVTSIIVKSCRDLS